MIMSQKKWPLIINVKLTIRLLRTKNIKESHNRQIEFIGNLIFLIIPQVKENIDSLTQTSILS